MITVHLETHTDAPPETVWSSLTNDIGDWWGEPYVSSAERTALTLDARPGGLLFEDWGDGNGNAWATVRTLRKPNRLEFDGTFMMYGAIHGTVAITIEPQPDRRTRIALIQQAIGEINDDTIDAWNAGWQDLIDSLINHCNEKLGSDK